MTRLLALDLSLNSTGWCVALDTYGTLDPGSRRGAERLSWVRDQVLELEHKFQIETVCIENYAFARPNQAHQVGELGGVVRTSLFDAGIEFVEVAPSSVKKYATGKGNASKNAMLVAAGKRLGYDGDSNDEADAMWLHALVRDALGLPWVTVPQGHRDAVEAVRASLSDPTEGAA